MILIKHEVKNSNTHGVGLFTKEDIKKGTLIAKRSPKLDVDITPKDFASLNDIEKADVLYWGFYDKATNLYHVTFDNIRFLNHSDNANVTEGMGSYEIFSKRDIKKGEELTQNYLEFEKEEDLFRRGIRK